MTVAERDGLAALLAERFPDADLRPEEPGVPAALPAPRLAVPDALAAWSAVDDRSRRLHAVGRSYVDSVAAFRGVLPAVPDAVLAPPDAAGVAAVLDWCGSVGAACIPVGGGTSVVGGASAPVGDRPVVALSTRRLDRVLEVDRVSRAALVQGGVAGPALEDQLRAHGLTMRFYPQSFELSTLGGWIVTRAAGHYATRLVHIDDLVESVTAVTPTGVWASRRLPGSGAGPSPDRLLLGSEGVLGVVTEAWVRLQARPVHRARADVRFPDFLAGCEAVRRIVQAGLDPANCRVLDPTEALLNGAGDGSAAVLVLAFESAHEPVDGDLDAALALAREAGGRPGGVESTVGATWRRSFLRAPYLRNALIALGVLSETFETATTWDRLPDLVEGVLAATRAAVTEVCGDGVVTVRLTHAYPDGAAPYVTVIAPARRGAEAAQWAEVKAAAMAALVDLGGAVTHHHAIGRDHRGAYDATRPPPFLAALGAAKRAVDPAGTLNPGVLLR